MSQRVFVVIEGEVGAYHFAFVPHAVFSQRDAAEAYVAELVRLNESQRWINSEVMEFELNIPGHVTPEE